MELAVVVGHCTATVKEASLSGRKLALVRAASPSGEPSGPVEVALDVTGAGAGQLVVLARGSAARQPAENRQIAVDLSIVAILDDVTVAPAQPQRSTKEKAASTTTRAKTRNGGR